MDRKTFQQKWHHTKSALQKEKDRLLELLQSGKINFKEKIRLNNINIKYHLDLMMFNKNDILMIDFHLKQIEKLKKENQKLTSLIKKENEILKRKQIRKKTIPKFLVNKKRK